MTIQIETSQQRYLVVSEGRNDKFDSAAADGLWFFLPLLQLETGISSLFMTKLLTCIPWL